MWSGSLGSGLSNPPKFTCRALGLMGSASYLKGLDRLLQVLGPGELEEDLL